MCVSTESSEEVDKDYTPSSAETAAKAKRKRRNNAIDSLLEKAQSSKNLRECRLKVSKDVINEKKMWGLQVFNIKKSTIFY